MIPAPYLPSTGGTIHGLEVNVLNTKSLSYGRLDIILGHTTLHTPDLTFATNLPSPVAVASSSGAITYAGGAWTPIMFSTPFRYNGRDNLVVETRKELSSPQPRVGAVMRNPLGPKADLPPMLVATGPRGSGMSNATVATGFGWPIRLRLLFEGTPTMTVRSDQRGPFNRVFSFGQPVTMTVHATDGVAGHFVDFTGWALLGGPVVLPMINGTGWIGVGSPLLWGVGTSPIANGQGSVTFPLPNDPRLVGLRMGFQSVVVGSAGLAWTCATRGYLNF